MSRCGDRSSWQPVKSASICMRKSLFVTPPSHLIYTQVRYAIKRGFHRPDGGTEFSPGLLQHGGVHLISSVSQRLQHSTHKVGFRRSWLNTDERRTCSVIIYWRLKLNWNFEPNASHKLVLVIPYLQPRECRDEVHSIRAFNWLSNAGWLAHIIKETWSQSQSIVDVYSRGERATHPFLWPIPSRPQYLLHCLPQCKQFHCQSSIQWVDTNLYMNVKSFIRDGYWLT
jgi:hypothetical protein